MELETLTESERAYLVAVLELWEKHPDLAAKLALALKLALESV